MRRRLITSMRRRIAGLLGKTPCTAERVCTFTAFLHPLNRSFGRVLHSHWKQTGSSPFTSVPSLTHSLNPSFSSFLPSSPISLLLLPSSIISYPGTIISKPSAIFYHPTALAFLLLGNQGPHFSASHNTLTSSLLQWHPPRTLMRLKSYSIFEALPLGGPQLSVCL